MSEKPRNNIKRGEGKNVYFTQETQDAIIRYNQTEDVIERNKIYNKYIRYPFEKIAENVIRTYNINVPNMPYEELKADVITHFNEKIHKYNDPTIGNAYSYFTVTAKNYVYGVLNYYSSKQKDVENYEDLDTYRNVVNEVVRDDITSYKKEIMDTFIKSVDKHLYTLFKTKNEQAIADSILEIFKRREQIENFNKKAFYIMIRDRTGISTKEITPVVSVLKDIYLTVYKNKMNEINAERL